MAVLCYKFAKYTLVAVTFLIMFNAILEIILGIWLLLDKTFFVSIAEEGQHYTGGVYSILASGFLMLTIAIFGSCGAVKHSRCMLLTFFGFMLIVVVGQLASVGWLCANKDRLTQLVQNSVINSIKNEYGEIECRTQVIDSIQFNFQCCGANGPADWAGSKYAKNHTRAIVLTVSGDATVYKVPQSCCKVTDSLACDEGRTVKVAGIPSSAIYSEGCTQKLMDILENFIFHIAIIIVIFFLIIEILAMICALICCCEGGSANRYKA